MISIVVPAYNEAENLEPLYNGLRTALEPLRTDWELVIVDDGSSDDTWERIRALGARDARVRGIRLSRNFGHQNALLAGLSAAKGIAVISMDADMQHPPSVVPQLLRKWQEGYQIVHAIRHDGENVSWLKRLTSRLYYRLFSYLSGVEIQPGAADFRLLDRQVVDELLQFKEDGLFLRGLVHWVGYDAATVTFECGDRHAGKSGYTLRKMLTLGWHGVSSFSLVPLRIAILVGLVSSTLAFLTVGYAILAWWIDHIAVVPGWASTVAIVSFLFSALFAFLAILAEYLGRVVEQVRGRPRFIVRETTQLPAAARRAARAELLRDAATARGIG